jgi:hypothetical protein
MQIAHTIYMDFNNLVSVQIKFKIFISKYLYIHSFSMPMGAKLIYKKSRKADFLKLKKIILRKPTKRNKIEFFFYLQKTKTTIFLKKTRNLQPEFLKSTEIKKQKRRKNQDFFTKNPKKPILRKPTKKPEIK